MSLPHSKEAAALQSFPNDFQFFGPISAQWRQIGNAIPPLLGKALERPFWPWIVSQKKAKRVGHRPPIAPCITQRISQVREDAFIYRRSANGKNVPPVP